MQAEVILEKLLGEFHTNLPNLGHLVPRDIQFAQAENKIRVAMGMRRAGKTYFVYQHILELLESGVPLSRILYINFEDDRLIPLTQKKLADLVDAFFALYPENHQQLCYLFLDEIQNVEDWPIVVRRFHDSKNVELYLTGSSAKLLSKEIASSLRGRSLGTEVWPFSFSEFLRAKGLETSANLYDDKTRDTLRNHFQDYLTIGGFPEVTNYQNDVRQQTLQDYIDVVIYRDIIERHQIKNPSAIKYFITSLLHNVGNPFSINKFHNDLKSQGYKIGKDALYNFFDYIEDAYLCFGVNIFDTSIRKVQSNPKKIYAIDPGLVRAFTLDGKHDFGRLFENVIYLELRRNNCKVNYYFTEQRYEIDFVVQSNDGRQCLLQVVWDDANEETYDRERRALESAQDELKMPGSIITLDRYLKKGLVAILEEMVNV